MADFKTLEKDNLFVVMRDEAVLATPAGSPYTVPTQALAEAIAAEWRAQSAKKKPDPTQMPLTQLAATAIDIVPKERERIIGQMVAYVSSELLCHRADTPSDLVALQHKIWQPYLDWFEASFGAKLLTGHGIRPLEQKAETAEAVQKLVSAYDAFYLTGLRQAADVTGSLVLALALVRSWKSPDDVLYAAELDSHYQISRWGSDPVIEAHNAAVLFDLQAVMMWHKLLGD